MRGFDPAAMLFDEEETSRCWISSPLSLKLWKTQNQDLSRWAGRVELELELFKAASQPDVS